LRAFPVGRAVAMTHLLLGIDQNMEGKPPGPAQAAQLETRAS
jgi:hypothetical protein